jgi:Zn ribbon nucleic-acid-binding protein
MVECPYCGSDDIDEYVNDGQKLIDCNNCGFPNTRFGDDMNG